MIAVPRSSICSSRWKGSVVPDRDDDRPGPLALSILSAAVVEDLKSDSIELTAILALLPEHQRARLLVLLGFDAEP